MDNNQTSEWQSISTRDIRPIRDQKKLVKRVIIKYSILISFTLILILAILQIKVTPAVAVSVNSKEIALAASKSDFYDVFNKIEKDYQRQDSNLKLSNDYKFKYTLVNSDSVLSHKEIERVIKDTSTVLLKAYSINVNGEPKVALHSIDEANQTLNKIKDMYKQEKGDLEFEENVEIKESLVPKDKIVDANRAFKVLTKSNDKITDYKVKEGDTLWDIADNNNISIEKLMKLNPNKLDKLYPGQIIKLSMPNYVINVKSTQTLEVEQKVSFKTEYKIDSEMYKGDRKIVKKGTYGKKNVKLQVIKQNGIEIAKKILNEKLISDPKPQVVTVGTKEYKNIFRKPVYGVITSRFGFRWGRQHEGVDIAGHIGEPVYAAAAGTVIYSGWETGYGNIVKIDHHNGYVTFYGHNSKNLVHVGQKVSKGTIIAKVGSTGHTTGPHVHFEVRENGRPIDPLKFLQ